MNPRKRRASAPTAAAPLQAGPAARRERIISVTRELIGELGIEAGDSAMVAIPSAFALDSVTTISLGEHHGCALLESGTVRCFGSGPLGEVGAGSLPADDCGGAPCYVTPVPVSDLSNVVSIAAGREHSCALLDSREVWCWGADDKAQLGNSSDAVGTCSTSGGDVPCARSPQGTYSITDAVSLRSGDDFTCAVRAGGEVICWGDNTFAQIGSYNEEPATFATPIYHLFPE